MKKTYTWPLLLIATLLLVLSACTQSGSESPQQAVGVVKSLAGTAWELEFLGEPDNPVPVIPGSRVGVNYFVERYDGYGGCNWFLGVYGLDDGNMRMETAATTTINCESQEITEQEQTFMAALLNVTQFRNEDNHMVGYTAQNQALLSLLPAQPVPFEGTTWEMKLNWDGEQWVPVLPLSTVTAQFEGDQVTGSGGCNSYSASVESDGNQLTIGPVAATRMACAEPVDIMQQEDAYFTQLASVASYSVAGSTLALLDANGEPILLFGITP
ncbi:MAG: META domain-containing protein [Candidatus Promineifilaceae bacterium]